MLRSHAGVCAFTLTAPRTVPPTTRQNARNFSKSKKLRRKKRASSFFSSGFCSGFDRVRAHNRSRAHGHQTPSVPPAPHPPPSPEPPPSRLRPPRHTSPCTQRPLSAPTLALCQSDSCDRSGLLCQRPRADTSAQKFEAVGLTPFTSFAHPSRASPSHVHHQQPKQPCPRPWISTSPMWSPSSVG